MHAIATRIRPRPAGTRRFARALLIAALACVPFSHAGDGGATAAVAGDTPVDDSRRIEDPAIARGPESLPARPALPRWEWGVGVAAAWLRDYPGSRHYDTYALPLPWFVWRSERVELGREGGRGILFRSPQFEVDFTLTANPPSSVGNNPERAGMPDLDAVLEPGLRAHWRQPLDAAGRWNADLRIPVRQAISIDGDLHTHAIGVHVEPGIALDWRLSPAWSMGASLGIGFAEKGYTDFYYGVPPSSATASRPAYTAGGGYTGWQAGLRGGWRADNVSASLFVRFEDVSGAAFADSPLVSTPVGWTVGGAVNWRLGQSVRKVGGR